MDSAIQFLELYFEMIANSSPCLLRLLRPVITADSLEMILTLTMVVNRF